MSNFLTLTINTEKAQLNNTQNQMTANTTERSQKHKASSTESRELDFEYQTDADLIDNQINALDTQADGIKSQAKAIEDKTSAEYNELMDEYKALQRESNQLSDQKKELRDEKETKQGYLEEQLTDDQAKIDCENDILEAEEQNLNESISNLQDARDEAVKDEYGYFQNN